nr:hypothetical protein [Polymorphobacter sp.]
MTSLDAPAALPAPPSTSLDPPLHPREGGWAVGVQRAFIEALAECGSVTGAARAVGMHPSSAYRLRAAPHGLGFRGAWNAALTMAYARLREVAFDRAVNGVEQPVFQGGEQVGTRIVHSDRLLMFLLDHVNKAVPRQDRLIGATADDHIQDHFAVAVEALDAPPLPPRHRGGNRSSPRPPRATTPMPHIPFIANRAATPAAKRFDPHTWHPDSAVDLVSTSAPQAVEPRHDL